jgi:cellobiose phosphorylase
VRGAGRRRAGRALPREAIRLERALERTWDGEWYRRGYYDDGSPLGSAQNEECRIDSIPQSWAVLSGAVPQRFADRAMDAVRSHLVRRGHRLVALLTPPFDRSPQEPGYIKGYPPGVRENGGQYTHAAVWTVMAMARLGYGDEAAELFHMLNPANHARTAADVERYKAEPYVLAGDVFAHPSHAGRAGWTWYTGSAGWMYRAGLESILGFRRRGATFEIDPCIPAAWPGLLDRLALRHDPLRRSTSSEPGAPLPGRRPGRARRRGGRPARDPAGRRRRPARGHRRPRGSCLRPGATLSGGGAGAPGAAVRANMGRGATLAAPARVARRSR